MYNPKAPYFLNGIPHLPPDGYEDQDFTYVQGPLQQGSTQATGIIVPPEGGGTAFNVTAVPVGLAGNGITVNLLVTNPNQALSITVVGTSITIELAAAGGSPTSLGSDVVNIITATPAAAALVTITAQNPAAFASAPTGTTLAGGLGGGVLPALTTLTFKFTTHTDSVFVWTGIETNFFYGTCNWSVTYGQETLMTGDIQNANTLIGSQGVPVPIFPSLHLMPGTEIQVTVKNTDPINNYNNLSLIMRGYKRRELIGPYTPVLRASL